MSGPEARFAPRLRALLCVVGSVAVIAGAFAVVTGPGGQTDGESVGASVDSEYRFYAAFWLAFGVTSLWVGLRADPDRLLVRGLGLFLLFAALARVVAWGANGRPHTLYVVLLGAEVLVACVLLAGARRLPGSDQRAPRPADPSSP